MARVAAVRIVRKLRAAGREALLAGGCVRDELLGLTPTDYDVATDARPEEVQAMFERTNAVGAAFGVVLVHTRFRGGGGRAIITEVATFREDGLYLDARRPSEVRFSDAEADARRRDFTVNALFLDPLAREDDGRAVWTTVQESGLERGREGARGKAGERGGTRGRVIDFVGGVEDLDRRVIRAVGDPAARLAEDHLRALRAVRFTCRLGFELEAATAEAVRADASELRGVSRERIGEEMRKMLRHPSRARSMAMLASLGLDVPALQAEMGGATDEAAYPLLAGIGRRREGGGRPRSVPIVLGLAALLIDRGADISDAASSRRAVASLRRALCLSNEERDGVAGALAAYTTLRGAWGEMSVSGQKRLAAAAGFDAARALLRAGDAGAEAAVAARVAELEAIAGGVQPTPLLNGDDLVRLGMTPGPDFSRILSTVYDAQLEGDISAIEQAESLARELAGGGGV